MFSDNMTPRRQIKRVPCALKWLTEKRARILHDLQFHQSLVAEFQDKVAAIQADLAAFDQSMRLFDSRLDPSAIEPVNGWRGRYGKRGALREFVVEFLHQQAPNWVSTAAAYSGERNRSRRVRCCALKF
jgi:hypothetical protein